jgi:hypothetical protein
MAIDFKDLFAQLKTGVINLAKEKFNNLTSEAVSDGTSLLHIVEADLKNYTQQLEAGEINADDFKLLLLGDQNLVEMSALTEAGLAEAAADAFKTEVFNMIVNTVLGAI